MVKLIETYKINQNVAAVTLIAFGNCAPDIISSLVASENDNISFSIGSIIGSGMFITSFVFGLVVFKGKEIMVNSLMFNRDIILYLISLSIIIVIGIKKNINLIDSLGLIIIYIVNVLLALFQGRKASNNKNDKPKNDEKESIDDDDDKEKIIKRDNDIRDINSTKDNINNSKYKPIELEQKNSNIDYFYKVYLNTNFNQDIINKQIFGEIKEDIGKEQETIIEIKKAYSQLINENLILAKIFFKKKFLFDKEKKWNEIPNYLKLFYIVFEFPLIIIREITIPICENKKWNKIKFCLLPLSDFLFISYIFNCK
jgi:sodium/potassium/calcium exchanger 6